MRRTVPPLLVLLALLLGPAAVALPGGATPAFAAPAAAADGGGPTTTTAAPKTTLLEVERELMCTICRVPLNQSDSTFANQERRAITDLIARGLTKQQVIDQMVRIYSPAVLLNPPDRTVRTLRWLLPVAGALTALVLLTVFVGRWRRRARDDGDQDGPADSGPDLSAEDERRLDADLTRYA